MEPKVKNKPTVRLNPEQLKKLDEIAEKKFRGASRTQTIGWIVEDEWEKLEKEDNVLHK
jgi:hypothetical protein